MVRECFDSEAKLYQQIVLENKKAKDIPRFYLNNLKPEKYAELDKEKFANLVNIDEKLNWIKTEIAEAAERKYDNEIEI